MAAPLPLLAQNTLTPGGEYTAGLDELETLRKPRRGTVHFATAAETAPDRIPTSKPKCAQAVAAAHPATRRPTTAKGGRLAASSNTRCSGESLAHVNVNRRVALITSRT